MFTHHPLCTYMYASATTFVRVHEGKSTPPIKSRESAHNMVSPERAQSGHPLHPHNLPPVTGTQCQRVASFTVQRGQQGEINSWDVSCWDPQSCVCILSSMILDTNSTQHTVSVSLVVLCERGGLSLSQMLSGGGWTNSWRGTNAGPPRKITNHSHTLQCMWPIGIQLSM